jgi:diguanylate cyclase (GGDEF)-like protein/PAS domain S-box-containing protein
MMTKKRASSSALFGSLGDDGFEVVMENLNDAILITEAECFDLHGPKILWANDAFYQLTGYEPTDVVGQTPRILQGPLTDRSVLETLRIALESSDVCKVEILNYKKDSSTFWSEFEVTPISNEAGFCTHWVYAQRDVTERRRLEASVIESEKRFSYAVQGANVGVWEWKLDTDSFYYSPICKLMLGYQDSESGDQRWDARIGLHPDDKVREQGMLYNLSQGRLKEYQTEFRLKHKEGHYVYIQSHASTVRNEDDKVIRIIGTRLDISQRKQAELRDATRTRVLELITGGESLAVVLAAIVRSVEQDNPAMLCSILLLDDADERLLCGAGASLPDFYNEAIHGIEVGVGFGPCSAAAFTNERVIVDDIKTHPYWVFFKKLANKAELVACWSQPVSSTTGNVLGTFAIYHRNVNQPTEADIIAMEQTASLVSIAVEKKQAEQKLTRAASVFTAAHEGIIITDAKGVITEVNVAFSDITGYAAEEVLGKLPTLFQSDRQSPEIDADILAKITAKSYWHGEIWSRRKNGEDYPLMLTTSSVKDAANLVQHYVSLLTDITSIKAYQVQLKRMAHYDALTNLPNRVLLTDYLGQSMSQCKSRNKSLVVVFMDLDGFKAVNDRHGHNIGDELLILLSERMQNALRQGDTLSRFGGDEFIAIMGDLENVEDYELVLKNLLQDVAKPITLVDDIMQVSVSIGITLYPQDNVDAEQLVRHAEQAMHLAKQAGKNCYRMFDVALDNEVKIHRKSISGIRSALNNDEFVLHYQPKVNMRTGKVIGVEALIRWQHPDRGLVPPSDFLSLIEGHSLSLEIGEWVVETALRQISQWRSMELYLPISVNISAHQLQQDNFTTRLAALLSAHPDVPSNYLELEILETSALQDTNQVSATMNACNKLGVCFALDDFGTGYSSLTYLKNLPAYLIKIDQSFVRNMLEDADDLAIIEGVVSLAKVFRRDVIAEGVETVDHGVALLQLGCELAQGYGIARPMPAAGIPEWVLSWKVDDSWQF